MLRCVCSIAGRAVLLPVQVTPSPLWLPTTPASLLQVKKPIYSSSLNKWPPYADDLAPLLLEASTVLAKAGLAASFAILPRTLPPGHVLPAAHPPTPLPARLPCSQIRETMLRYEEQAGLPSSMELLDRLAQQQAERQQAQQEGQQAQRRQATGVQEEELSRTVAAAAAAAAQVGDQEQDSTAAVSAEAEAKAEAVAEAEAEADVAVVEQGDGGAAEADAEAQLRQEL